MGERKKDYGEFLPDSKFLRFPKANPWNSLIIMELLGASGIAEQENIEKLEQHCVLLNEVNTSALLRINEYSQPHW